MGFAFEAEIRCGGRLIAAPTEGWLPTGGWGHPPLRGCRDGPVLLAGAGPRPARGRPQGSPLRRKTGRDRWLGKLRRRNETAPLPIFLPLRPPVGPDGMAPKHSWFCAPEGIYLPLGVTPVMGVQGVGEYGRGASILSPPLGGSLVSFCPGRKKLAPQGEIPLRTTNAVRNPPPHPSGIRPATFPPGGRL